jgi:hypothetical protein
MPTWEQPGTLEAWLEMCDVDEGAEAEGVCRLHTGHFFVSCSQCAPPCAARRALLSALCVAPCTSLRAPNSVTGS